MAWAPKLMRLENGVFGAPRALSSSSIAFSSIESELLVDMLPRRRPIEEALVGEVPERPRPVVTERRRRWSFMAAVVTGPGNTPVPVEVELLLWKRLLNAAEVTEPRRVRAAMSGGVLLFSLLSLDIVTVCSGFQSSSYKGAQW